MPVERTLVSYGFTLIEISIVLVIIGLVTAGVLVGKDLIRQAELRSVITDFERYNTAVNAFRAKYNCLPGDCAYATDFFGTQTDGGGCPYPTVESGTENPLTCNGDGNGYIWGNPATAPFLQERVRFWQHLSAAGLVQHYSGIGNTSQGEPINLQAFYFGYNAPETKLPRTGFVVYHGSTWDLYFVEYFKPLSGSHVFILGTTDGCDDTTCTVHTDPVIAASSGTTPENAFMLDRKADDGKPGGGAITAPPTDGGYFAGWTFCTTGDHTQAETATYNLNTETPVCPLFFRAMF
ncbi:MAG: type II secretion system protein [Alphaproteobacteria bacterium]